MLRASVVVAVAVLLAGFAQAAPVACEEGVNVLTLSDPCTLDGGMVVGGWSVDFSGFTSVTVNYESSTNNDILFQIVTDPQGAPAGSDITLQYYVYSGLVGVDIDLLNGTAFGAVSIIENVFDESGKLAELFVDNVSGPWYSSTSVEGTAPFRIRKDISFGSGARLSDFTNSHEIPEPSTYLLMGTGLLAVGLARQRWARRK